VNRTGEKFFAPDILKLVKISTFSPKTKQYAVRKEKLAKIVLSCPINDQIFTTRPKTKLAKCIKLTKSKSVSQRPKTHENSYVFFEISQYF
jgi:hypothetical protein